MALPETVIQQLGRETPKTPGWSGGVIAFSGGIFLIVLFLWAGLAFGYKPYLDGQAQNVQDQITQLNNSISAGDQANLINFYSQLSNLNTLLVAHTPTSNVFPWLEANTEDNIYYTSFALSQGGQLSLGVDARTENDANQQIAIFENSPQVKSLTVSGISFATNGFWQFDASLILDPSVFAQSSTSSTSQTQ